MVYLIGAGPGDPGLLTLHAARILRRANVIVHDALVDPRVLDLAPARARRIDVGKRAGARHAEQQEIHALLIAESLLERVVVRLKGGDPFVFGRGAEEVGALSEAGVPFRVVPGITSGLGAMTAAGIPATARGVASAVTLVTGHGAGSDALAGVNWPTLAASGATLVVYMGTRTIGRISAKLIAAGMAPDTPTAIIERATWPGERVVQSRLGEIADMAAKVGIEAPALFVIGDVVALRHHASVPATAKREAS